MTYKEWYDFWGKIFKIIAWTVFFPITMLIHVHRWWKKPRPRDRRDVWGWWFFD